jgi:hypothetical protein
MKYLFPTQDFPPRIQYEKIFSLLPSFPNQNEKRRGRPAVSKDSILRSLIYKNLRGLPSLSELVFELKNNPAMADILGFPIWKVPPSIERFSHFLRDTPNENLQHIRLLLVRQLMEEKILPGEILALDSCAIEANVKENNLKTAVASRFDKTIIPRGDPEAKLGIKVHYPKPFQRRITFFWGYRNHAVSDSFTELPILERTLAAEIFFLCIDAYGQDLHCNSILSLVRPILPIYL